MEGAESLIIDQGMDFGPLEVFSRTSDLRGIFSNVVACQFNLNIGGPNSKTSLDRRDAPEGG
jgi:hypothetical protein